MTRHSADEVAARAARMEAIRRCRRCDPSGWRLGPDGTPVGPATRCHHDALVTAPAGRDVTELIHQTISECTR